MPLGFERLNERSQRPNANINFIKTVSKGPDQAIAEEFLSRIAAQCYPVMKKHYITVMALEEYPANPEFLGRNFNAGEVIQLVLKDKQGRWLSFKFVQMVMMHELAHCKQMNHSKFFWVVRNEYAQEMEGLWQKQYEGEGMWGRGRGLQNGAFVHAQPPDNTQIPAHLCGGTYRRRGRKRKRGAQQGQADGEQLSYAERQQKRIQKKLGKHGVSMKSEVLGDDELTRGALETMNGGKRGAGKPKVANSKRGRELRANAALARFEALKQQPPEKTPELEDDLDSETESEWEQDRMDNVVIKDEHGRDMVKVCGDGEDGEEGAGREMDELRTLSQGSGTGSGRKSQQNPPCGQKGHEDSETESEAEDELGPGPGEPSVIDQSDSMARSTMNELRDNQSLERKPADGKTKAVKEPTPPDLPRGQVGSTFKTTDGSGPTYKMPVHTSNEAPRISSAANMLACPICSLENEPGSPTCMACAHVLRPGLVPNNWVCKSKACKDGSSTYINAGDAGRCGICGQLKTESVGRFIASPRQPESRSARSTGLTGADILRWD